MGIGEGSAWRGGITTDDQGGARRTKGLEEAAADRWSIGGMEPDKGPGIERHSGQLLSTGARVKDNE
jgi:hypothetical protein